MLNSYIFCNQENKCNQEMKCAFSENRFEIFPLICGSPSPLVVRVTPLPGWCGTSSHPGMRSRNLKKYEIDNISQAVNFERDSNRFPRKFLNVDLSYSGIGILIGCEQKNAGFRFHILLLFMSYR